MSTGLPDNSLARAIGAAISRPNGRVALDLEKYFDELEDAIIRLSREVKELRANAMKFKGAWAGAAVTYRRGDVVLRDGLPWHCNSADGTTERPGSSDSWSMLGKSHR